MKLVMNGRGVGGWRAALAALGMAVLVAACAPVQDEVGQCEPGVDTISEMATVTPPGC
ncbi:hypothetical protein [Phaeovulum sp. NW3]|uniref:hypothetical protein n=1 Tax=Phaeovulum sp. NW3 TaxID=2934933 RepID=UPI00202040A0|nr:hypothetical protein [Phaeovulum sp. NW3]MCL7465034.1 hypothetical protein [Phaeovulum sp. NW3]